MSRPEAQRGTPTRGTTDQPLETRSLSLRAELVILAGEELWSTVDPLLPVDIPVTHRTTPAEFRAALSGNVAVALFPARMPDHLIEELTAATLSSCEHARIGLLATDGSHLLRCDHPYDMGSVFPDESAEFPELLKRLYVRAYYCVALERYYRIGLSIRNQQVRDEGDPDHDLATLEQARQRVRTYLDAFKRYLGPEDVEAISSRSDRLEVFLGSQLAESDPAQVGLPDACPGCHLDWTTWHGPRQRCGYERIGAGTWRCTACGHVMADSDPDNYRVS